MPKYRIVIAYETHQDSLEDAVKIAGQIKQDAVMNKGWVKSVEELDV